MKVYNAINLLSKTNCNFIKIYNNMDNYYYDLPIYKFMMEDLEIPLDRQIAKNILESNVYEFILCCTNGRGVIIYEE